jgi:hypothetical protein
VAIWTAGVACAPPALGQEAPMPSGAPSALAVDPEAAERALERSLVRQGELLLAPGQVELEPSLVYQYTERATGFALTFRDLDGDGLRDDPVVENVQAQEDRTNAAIEARVGLPRDSQFEIRLPVIHVDQQLNRSFSGTVANEDTTGFGDVRVGFAKTLARENGAMPDLIGRVAWDTATGDDDETISLTTGYDELIVSLRALRRLDPLALTGGVFYQTAFERDSVKPGDVFGFSVGTTLAASPTTALRIGFDAEFRQETEVQDVEVPSSDENEAVISFGIASIVRRNALLSINFGAGLTEDSPDYFISASLPIQFTAWR